MLKLAWCTYCIIFSLVQLTQADYVLEVRAHTYTNSDHRDSNGDCCDPGCGGCDNLFIFCLRRSSTANDGNSNNCPLDKYTTTSHIENDNFTFSSPIDSDVPNPMTFNGSVWPVSHTSKVEESGMDICKINNIPVSVCLYIAVTVQVVSYRATPIVYNIVAMSTI